jgi:hypothetical protein
MSVSKGVNNKPSDDDNLVTASIDGINHFVKKDLPAMKKEFITAKDDLSTLATDLKKEAIYTKDEFSSFIDDFKEVKSAFKDIFKLF